MFEEGGGMFEEANMFIRVQQSLVVPLLVGTWDGRASRQTAADSLPTMHAGEPYSWVVTSHKKHCFSHTFLHRHRNGCSQQNES